MIFLMGLAQGTIKLLVKCSMNAFEINGHGDVVKGWSLIHWSYLLSTCGELGKWEHLGLPHAPSSISHICFQLPWFLRLSLSWWTSGQMNLNVVLYRPDNILHTGFRTRDNIIQCIDNILNQIPTLLHYFSTYRRLDCNHTILAYLLKNSPFA